MTEELFRQDARLHACSARITACTDVGIELDRTVFYPLGVARRATAACWCSTTAAPHHCRHTQGQGCRQPATGGIVHNVGRRTRGPAGAPGARPSVTARIDAERRQRMMRLHTTTHLLCRMVPHLVNGCSITPDYARLDFAMTDPLDKERLTAAIAALVAAALPVTVASISDEELDANPASSKACRRAARAAPGASAPSALAPGRPAHRPAALRRHPCSQHGRDWRHRGHQNREEKRHYPPGGAGFA